jgi:amino acid permease
VHDGQGSAETGESSYASLAGRLVGPAGSALLQAALFGFCFGVMAVYLVVIGDILAGELCYFALLMIRGVTWDLSCCWHLVALGVIVAGRSGAAVL